ncbi:PKD domain-containing protein [Pimelobacter simplex]|uniref:PKD domain-containing protein n=1 Tax=Nocardioides simplex TaxID=2045 RepID=A0A7J5DXH9_NOCSI|nr:PKD domain-containing protein [Pimelobacter simplex]KAB2810711.1 PKD domain-containing protein [Pimelobacter simplex]
MRHTGAGGGGGDSPSASAPSAPAIILGAGACGAADGLADAIRGASEATFCPGTTPTQPTLTLADIRRAFAELPLPTPTLVIQPPDGVTLVNFDTNFYTAHTAPLTRTVTLLGQRVTIRATPAAYTWTYGDGAARTTADPGAPYPDLRVTHRYERKGVYRARLAVTYDGSYRVGQGGPWRAIPGRVTVAGAPQGLRAVEATPTLVGY